MNFRLWKPQRQSLSASLSASITLPAIYVRNWICFTPVISDNTVKKMEEETGRKVKYFCKSCSPAGGPTFSKKIWKIFFLMGALRYLSWKIFSLKGRHARVDEQLYFSGHTYACNWVCDVSNTGQAGYLSDNHVNDWRDNLGMSEYSLCLRKWASPAYETYRHESWEPSLVRSESWLEGR